MMEYLENNLWLYSIKFSALKAEELDLIDPILELVSFPSGKLFQSYFLAKSTFLIDSDLAMINRSWESEIFTITVPLGASVNELLDLSSFPICFDL